MDEKTLVEKLKKGDSLAKEVFVRKYQNLIFNAILQVSRDRDLSMDVLEETFIKAFKYIRNFRGESEVTTWLYRIAMNTLKDEAKKASRHHSLDENAYDKDVPPQDYALEDKKKVIWEALSKLDDKDREVLTLVDIQGKSYEETAFLSEIPVNTVRSRLFRARERLKKELEKNGFFEDGTF